MLVRICYGVSLIWGSCYIFLMVILGLSSFWRKTAEIKFHFGDIILIVCTANNRTSHQHCRHSPFLPFHAVLFGKR